MYLNKLAEHWPPPPLSNYRNPGGLVTLNVWWFPLLKQLPGVFFMHVFKPPTQLIGSRSLLFQDWSNDNEPVPLNLMTVIIKFKSTITICRCAYCILCIFCFVKYFKFLISGYNYVALIIIGLNYLKHFYIK